MFVRKYDGSFFFLISKKGLCLELKKKNHINFSVKQLWSSQVCRSVMNYLRFHGEKFGFFQFSPRIRTSKFKVILALS